MKSSFTQTPAANTNVESISQQSAQTQSKPTSDQGSQQTPSEIELFQIITKLEAWELFLSLIKDSPDDEAVFYQALNNCSEISEIIGWLSNRQDDFLASIYQKFIKKYQAG